MPKTKKKTKRRPLLASIVGERCIYCDEPAEVRDHIIPKKISPFFDAGWNLAPSCAPCNFKKSDSIAIKYVKVPGEDPHEDAAIWATVYNQIQADAQTKRDIVLRMRDHLSRYGWMNSLGYGAFEVFTGRHFCELWQECQQGGCDTGGQLIELMGKNQVSVWVPVGLEGLIRSWGVA